MADTKPTYLALGDSYTIGEGVNEAERWPVMLADKMNWQPPRIVATTGWKTFELIEAIEKSSLDENYDWVSLLIGVNNQYRQLPFDDFQQDLERLADLIRPLVSRPDQIFMLSIPDYSVTPFARDHDTQKISAELEQYNIYIQDFAGKKGYQFCSITDISMKAGQDSSLLVEDELHPSGRQYRMWVNRIVDRCDFSR